MSLTKDGKNGRVCKEQKRVRLIELHDKLNPTRIIPFDADDFSAAIPWCGGSLLKPKDSEALIPVAETPEQIEQLVNGEK